jgi:signal transduction histidine kinase
MPAVIYSPNKKISAFFILLSKILCFLVFLIGLMASAGWQFNILIFKSILPSLPIMAPNTAVALAVSGISLWLLQEERSESPWRFLAYFFSIAIGILGLITFLEYILGLNLGIDSLFFKGALGSGKPVRMSPQSSVLFFLLGISLLLINVRTKSGKKPSQYIILIVGTVALFTFLGFIHNVPSFYTISPYKGMAAHTALAFLMLFLAAFISRPASGMMKTFSSEGISGYVARRLFLALFILVPLDIIAMTGHSKGMYSHETEAVLHIFFLFSTFIYLMFIGFGSLDKIQAVEEVNRAKSEFVSFVSHQLQNPLTAIKWSSNALLGDNKCLDKNQAENITNIKNGTDQMINLINAFLDVSKIEQGTFLEEIKNVNLPEIADSVLEEQKPRIQQKELRIIREYEKNMPLVKMDAKLAKIIFQNLVTNAIQYTQPKGEIHVSIKPAGKKVEISVKDTGLGIPYSQQAEIFKKLFRGQNIKKETKGSGLGLYIVKTLLDRINGKIWFESKEGKGTTFFVSLPVDIRT